METSRKGEKGFLPALESLLADPAFTDVVCVGGRAVFGDRGQGLELLAQSQPEEEGGVEGAVMEWTVRALARVGKSWDARSPFVDAVLPSGHRLHALFPPLSPQGLQLSLRRLPKPEASTDALPGRWSDDARYHALRARFASGETVLVSGATGSGKTTFAGDLLAAVPNHERVVALEDTPELAPAHPHFVSLLSRTANADGFGEVGLRTLFRQALRMRPDRIVLGECRGSEVLELLQALNTGHRGSIATLHANSPRDALRRVELLCLMTAGASGLTAPVVRELLASSIRWLVHLERTPSGPGQPSRRRIASVMEIAGKEGDTLLLREVDRASSGR